ncbi:MAG TPA: Rieske 2Fe-2S domain-containing protein [Nitrososphaerales archaeon]|nr:Rieske 2Fe-2S domain-containing protein [Nitrososphaerales archaeon]
MKYQIANVKDIAPGTMVGAEVGGKKILVANIGGEFFAMGSVCNHRGGPLDKGKLEGNVVTCPWHGSRWDVKTGKLVEFPVPLQPEPVFKALVEGDEVLVEF